MPPGAVHLGEGRSRFVVWAPRARRVHMHILDAGERVLPLRPRERGYHEAVVDDAPPGTLYRYRLDDGPERPDPASRFQPHGVHGPSQVVDPGFEWSRPDWAGLPLEDHVQYEVHVGTFTAEGTFDAAIPRLDDLRDLGVTALELMPVAQFPGKRNWGYDGAHPYAVQESYGGPAALKRLVDACHARGMAVILDVVYNHLGPEGNYLAEYGPYFTDRYKTPWGWALNFDGEGSDEVRRYFVESARMWIAEFRIDALRLDALHAIVDPSARPFLAELADEVRAEARRAGRRVHLIAETDRNDPRFVRPIESGGFGMDAQWNDDFHHSLHTLLTGERAGYYEDFGAVEHLARAWREGYVYSGRYSAYRRRRHGAPALDVPPRRFVVAAQTHDQVGNRMLGERLGALVSQDRLRLAAGAVILSPYVPLLFMGEEYGETAPFLFFIDHGDPALVEAVRRGRREEFARFGWSSAPPDPQAESTFTASKLNPSVAREGESRRLREFYRELIGLRKSVPALRIVSREGQSVACHEPERILIVHQRAGAGEVLIAYNFGEKVSSIPLPDRHGSWRKRIDSADERWGGAGAAAPEVLDVGRGQALALPAWSFAAYVRVDGDMA